jgi:hypothetical protein
MPRNRCPSVLYPVSKMRRAAALDIPHLSAGVRAERSSSQQNREMSPPLFYAPCHARIMAAAVGPDVSYGLHRRQPFGSIGDSNR